MAAADASRHAWAAVLACSLAIFLTVPLAENIQEFVSRTAGRGAFLGATLAAGCYAVWWAVRALRSRGEVSIPRAAALAAAAGLFVERVFALSANPEEAMHFVEYGLLGVLALRALSLSGAGAAAYWGALMVGASVGLLDEALQWVTPGRYWELRDIGLNLTAVVLVLVAVAAAGGSSGGKSSLAGKRRVVRITAVALVLLALSLLNTPARIAWYTAAIPALAPLADSENAMFEYGYYYRDTETGSFKSRLPRAELARQDAERGEEVAAILDAHRDPSTYAEFLRKYSPVSDPFAHEFRVHLFRRDKYIERAMKYEEGSDDHRYRITVSYSEHLILNKYFGNTLAHSSYSLPPERVAYLESHLLPDERHASAVARSESAVSRGLVTAVTETTVVALLVFAGFVLFALDRALARRER